MATRIENHCCDCAVPAYPCLGEHCSRRRVLVCYCDRCGDQVETLHRAYGMDLCDLCRDDICGVEEDE